MIRERALKVVLVLAGLLFTAAVYPAVFMHLDDQALRMMLSVYATLGIFLLLAARNPSEHRSLVAFRPRKRHGGAGLLPSDLAHGGVRRAIFCYRRRNAARARSGQAATRT